MPATPLYLRWLWWKHTWTFQAAHKPLCGRFHRDVLRIGPLHLCRSCAALYGSFALALALAPFYVPYLGMGTAMAVAALLGFALYRSMPSRYGRASRRERDLLRGGAGGLAGLAVALLFTTTWPAGLTMLIALGIAWRVYQRQREAAHSPEDTCASCPEYGRGGICAGYVKQARHLRAYEEAATDWLERRLTPPAT